MVDNGSSYRSIWPTTYCNMLTAGDADCLAFCRGEQLAAAFATQLITRTYMHHTSRLRLHVWYDTSFMFQRITTWVRILISEEKIVLLNDIRGTERSP